MKRMHVGLQVDDIGEAVAFYTRLFGQAPTLERSDYAKWMLDDPYVNFSVDVNGDAPSGSAHFGFQLESHADLDEMRSHVDAAELPRADQNDLVCGYQLQHKSWVDGPSGERWELFFTEGVVEGGSYGCADMPD